MAFQDKRFARELKEFETAVDEALEEAVEGKAQMSKIAEFKERSKNSRRKLEQEIDPENDQRPSAEAGLRLKDLRKTARQFETQGVQQALGEIDKYSGTTVNDLKIFMRKYNLTFGSGRDA